MKKHKKHARKGVRKSPGAKSPKGGINKKPLVAEKIRRKLINNSTRAEKLLKLAFKRLDIKYVFQYIIKYDTSFYVADFYLPDYNLVLEVDGEYHSASVKQVKKDMKRTSTITALGYKLARLTNEQVYKWPLEKIKIFVEKTLK